MALEPWKSKNFLLSEPRGLLHKFCCKLALFAEIWTNGFRTLEIQKFPPLRTCAGDQIIVHMRARELRVPSLEESDGCTMHMSKGMQKQTAIGPLVQIYLFSPLEDHEILLVLWASD